MIVFVTTLEVSWVQIYIGILLQKDIGKNVLQIGYMYRVSQKKLHIVLEGRSTPKFWARNKSWGCFGILRF